MLKTKLTNLYEHVQAAPGRIDRANGVVRGVKILGRTSKNGREYSPKAMAQAAKLYEGASVNANHPSRTAPNASRTIEDGIGWLENVSVKGDGVYGDLHVLKSHRLAESIFEVAERNPSRFGLSHNASGDAIQRNGKMIVESVVGVRSVDLVQNPATNQSLFESRLYEMDGNDPFNANHEPDPCADLKRKIRGALSKPEASDEDKIAEVLAIIGDEPTDADEPPVGAEQMAESYREHRAPRRNLQERASTLMESYGGRPIDGTKHATDRETRVKELMKRYR